MYSTNINESIFASYEQFAALLEQWRSNGHKIVFTNGCFDIIHVGHVDYLNRAKSLGHKLIVGLNTDASVKRLKGPSRPLNSENARAKVLASLKFVDAVVLFDDDTPLSLIKAIAPHVLTKGADYMAEHIVGAKFVVENGGEVITIPLVEGFSSSAIINRIKHDNS